MFILNRFANLFIGSAVHSNIYILLNLFMNSSYTAMEGAIVSLLTQIFKDNLLFQHDPEELPLWLEALPKIMRGPDAETPDGAKLTDERQSVLMFLDDCFQRCGKAPYRYLEELFNLVNSSSSGSDAVGRVGNASPLLATCLEQLGAKLKSQLLSPSDALALTTYIRKVTVLLLGKQPDLALCESVVTRLRHILSEQDIFPNHPIINGALSKELTLLSDCIDCCKGSLLVPDESMEDEISPNMAEFLRQVEQVAACKHNLSF